ncbi:Tetratricopeptide repeat-containing protein [Solimonas aquatica]|uniref:Tetratricopeptide repeat-containing protein n=1 Tax=Solimonas aquatica TaxID=489703 RepID=A0A1H9HYK1_9GAMM|nr:DUF1329 domain-containing protein [Solimonas aquatica]SEQ67337.1 Tetratricopeptide repeat-containing protein [Solimonas aquatica]
MRLRALLFAAGAALALPALADQYRSEQRLIDTPQQDSKPQDPQQLLKITTDPYAKAILLRDLAGRAAQNKDYDQAAKYLEQALAQNILSAPAAAQMRSDLTQLYLARGDLKKVLPQLEAQVKSGQAPANALVGVAAAYVEQKRYGEAIPLLLKAGADKPGADISWRRTLAVAYIGAGREREALPYLEQLLKEDPTRREDWLRLAAIHLKAGNSQRAAAVMEVASRLGFLQSSEERLRLVTLTAQIGAPFEAGSLLQQWQQRKLIETNLATQKLLANLWLAAREDSLALPALETVARAAPSAEVWQQLAQLHLDRSEYGDAASALEQALKLGGAQNKNAGKLYLALGLARYQQADVDGAKAAFAQAGGFAEQKKSAGQWLKYLELSQAREQAMAAAAQRQQRAGAAATLANRLDDSAPPSMSSVAAGAAPGGGALTPVGAEASGNADGSIPAWTGGLQKAQWPAAYRPGQRLVNPYENEKPLFTITRDNLAQYRAQLSAGHLALFARYADYRMPVYATHRSVAYPQAIYEASAANKGRARLLGSDALENARLGFPFPEPRSGVEIMWNHRTRYRGNTLQMQSTQAVVGNSEPQLLNQTERIFERYANIADPADLTRENILLYYLTWFGKSRNGVDFVALVHETTNSLRQGRNIWVIPEGMRRMFRVPPVGYDQPFPGAQGLMFIDMVDMYNGAFDRYVWRLTGKRELYIPYNAYALSDGRYRYAQLLTPRFLNPAGTRYERHRVWVIEAEERGGKHHAFGRRTFYVDEDSWNVVLVENEDHEGKLWRFQEGHLLPAYNALAANCAPVVTYDFKDGRYFANRLLAEDPPPQFDLPMKPGEFLPDAVRARYGH